MQFGQRSMECQHIARFLAVLICANSAFGAPTVTGPAAVEQGQDAVFSCSEDPLPDNPAYGWYDAIFSNGNPQQLFSGETSYVSGEPKFQNFGVSEGGAVMTITGAAVEDEGPYYCSIQGTASESSDFSVEVGSTPTMMFSMDPLIADIEFTATCNVSSRPQLNISWTLNDVAVDESPVVTNTPNGDVFDTRSEITFTPNIATNGQHLKCTTSGHVVMSLNSQATTQLNVQYAPTSETATIDVEFTKVGDMLRVTCQVSAAVDGVDPANPDINMYTIYAVSGPSPPPIADSYILVDIPENDTTYKCSASNGVGTIESEPVTYDPGQTTTQPTTTGGGLTIGATVGIVIGVLLLIALVVVLVVFLVKKKDSGPPPKTMALQEQKPTNGNSEKAAHPTAAPRQSTVPHRNDNPGGAVYAEVQKGGRGYDQPDHTHPPQGDSGMNYATLDLSVEAGHTERQVPQNKDNVVVYSSILV